MGLEKVNLVQSFGKIWGWKRLRALQLAPWHVHEKDQGMGKVEMDRFRNRNFVTGEGKSWGKGWSGRVMGTKGNGFIKHL